MRGLRGCGPVGTRRRTLTPGGLNAPGGRRCTQGGMPQRLGLLDGVRKNPRTKEADGRSSFVVMIVTNFLSSLYLTLFPIQNE